MSALLIPAILFLTFAVLAAHGFYVASVYIRAIAKRRTTYREANL